ncbi:MAG: hypothetical protein HY907_09235 [Deltaproteobacteria bacterium]|nr:hypothetical protein [Deltaproteobacteria bacterium]
MRNGKLTIHKVRRYRKARYPSRHPQARRTGTIAERVLRGAAVPAVALGLGTAGGACDGGLNLAGTEPDAADATDTTADVAPDTTTPIDAIADVVAPEDVAAEDITPEDVAPEDASPEDAPEEIEVPDGLNGDMPAGTYYLRYLSEAEGRTLIHETVLETDGDPTPPCDPATLGERLNDDQPFAHDGETPVAIDVDLLSDPYVPPCARPGLPAVGFEWMTEEARDDEDLTANPAGVSAAETSALRALRESRAAAISVLRATDYSYGVWEYEDGWIDDSDRTRAESLVRETVREIVDDLRRNGFI